MSRDSLSRAVSRVRSFFLSVPALLRRDWRLASVVALGLAGVFAVWLLSNRLIDDIRKEGVAFGKVYFEETSLLSQQLLADAGPVSTPCRNRGHAQFRDSVFNSILRVLELNEFVPVVIVNCDNDSIADSRNLTPSDDSASYELKAAIFKSIRQLCDSADLPEVNQRIFYGESNIVHSVSTIRVIEVLFFVVFGAGVFFVLRQGFRRQRDAEFRGISKEYAHQLGTPLQSLMGCYDLLAEGAPPADVLDELNGDIERLAEVGERLQRQGDGLKLKLSPLNPDLAKVADYIRVRTSRHVQVDLLQPDGEVAAPHDPTLFRWAVENICKNAADAIGPRPGRIVISLRDEGRKAVVEISDNGRGMTPDTKVRVFDSGFSTKEKGWGVGLALVRRIIVAGHHGEVFVERTQPGVGTTFKIILNKQ